LTKQHPYFLSHGAPGGMLIGMLTSMLIGMLTGTRRPGPNPGVWPARRAGLNLFTQS